MSIGKILQQMHNYLNNRAGFLQVVGICVAVAALYYSPKIYIWLCQDKNCVLVEKLDSDSSNQPPKSGGNSTDSSESDSLQSLGTDQISEYKIGTLVKYEQYKLMPKALREKVSRNEQGFVVDITLKGARDFAEWMSDNSNDGIVYRLPTLADLEFLALELRKKKDSFNLPNILEWTSDCKLGEVICVVKLDLTLKKRIVDTNKSKEIGFRLIRDDR